MEDDEKSSRGFKVEDRRRFSASGEPVSTEGDPPEPTATPQAESPPRADAGAPPKEPPPLTEMTFSTFVIGLSTQALVLMGEIADPEGLPGAADLVGAKQLVDILGMLQAKTRGNLDEAETALLDNALYDLRMKYVQRMRSR